MPRSVRVASRASTVAMLAAIATLAILAAWRCRTCKCPAPAPVTCPATPTQRSSSDAEARDRRVLSDPLYPPLNRTDLASRDAFRLVAYLTAPQGCADDAAGGRWRLFGRMKDRHQGQFYASPVDRTLDLKVMLEPEVVADGERLRDLYTIPRHLRFKSPLLSPDCAYEVTELPRSADPLRDDYV
jgi:hypothetical protein